MSSPFGTLHGVEPKIDTKKTPGVEKKSVETETSPHEFPDGENFGLGYPSKRSKGDSPYFVR